MKKHFKELTPEQITLNESFQKRYDTLMAGCYAHTGPLCKQRQEYYDKIRDLQKQIDAIEAEHRKIAEGIRKEAVLAGATSGFLCGSDYDKYDLSRIKKSAKTREKVLSVILKGNKSYDETSLYNKIKQIAGDEEAHNMSMDDSQIIYEKLNNLDRYIHGM